MRYSHCRPLFAVLMLDLFAVSLAERASVSAEGIALPADEPSICPVLSPLCDNPRSCPPSCLSVPDPQSSVVMRVLNQQMGNLELLYVKNCGEEMRYWVIDSRGEFTFSTRVGDRWRLRMKSGALAFEISVGRGTNQVISVPPCLLPAQQHAAALAQRHDAPFPDAAALHECNPWKHLSISEPSPGLHIACVLPGDSHTLAVWADGWTGGKTGQAAPSHSIFVPTELTEASDLALLVMERLQVPTRGRLHNSPAVYTSYAKRLRSAAEVKAERCVFIFEGGLWMWPGGGACLTMPRSVQGCSQMITACARRCGGGPQALLGGPRRDENTQRHSHYTQSIPTCAAR